MIEDGVCEHKPFLFSDLYVFVISLCLVLVCACCLILWYNCYLPRAFRNWQHINEVNKNK